MKNRLTLVTIASLLVSLSASVALAEKPLLLYYPTITDAKGIPRMEYHVGEKVCVWITVYASPVRYIPPLIRAPFKILIVVETRGIAYVFGVVSGTITTGQTKTYSFNFTVPKGVPPGFHVVKLMAWNGLISDVLAEWKSLATPVSASFLVVGG